jgi:cell division protein FtsL
MTNKTEMTKKRQQNDKKMTDKTEMTKKMTKKTTKNDKIIILIFSTFACLSFF